MESGINEEKKNDCMDFKEQINTSISEKDDENLDLAGLIMIASKHLLI